MMIRFVKKYNVIKLTVILSVFIIFFVTLSTFVLSSFFDRQNITFGTLVGFFLSATVSPLISYHFFRLYKNSLSIQDELRGALAKVHRLEKLIPICASCKSIRDDSGYWEKVEDYISQRTTAMLSHGICPNCKDKLLDDYKQGTM